VAWETFTWQGIVHGLWLFLPAYLANMAPVFVAKILPGWNAPIDGGRVAKDGKRVLGAGKTWRGLVGGALFGGLVALAMVAIAPHWGIVNGWDFGSVQAVVLGGPSGPGEELGTPTWHIALFGAIVGTMALIGDAAKSYFKRRTGRDGGAPWFPFDQLDFVVFGLLGMVLASPLLPWWWFQRALLGDGMVLITIVILTPGLHLLVNRIGFWLGLKKVPW
jgi:CDP-2,3-bis-(O-geranylgeranyl)-sn-glycerol synthase